MDYLVSARRDGHELNANAIYEVGWDGAMSFLFIFLVISHNLLSCLEDCLKALLGWILVHLIISSHQWVPGGRPCPWRQKLGVVRCELTLEQWSLRIYGGQGNGSEAVRRF